MSVTQPQSPVYHLTQPEASYARPMFSTREYVAMRTQLWKLVGQVRQAANHAVLHDLSRYHDCQQVERGIASWRVQLFRLNYGHEPGDAAAVRKKHQALLTDVDNFLNRQEPK